MLKNSLTILFLFTYSLFAERLSMVSYYECGYNENKPSKCFLYMPFGKLLATHTAGGLNDYEEQRGVEAIYEYGTLCLAKDISLNDKDSLTGRCDSVDFYFIERDLKGPNGKSMFYLYAPNLNYLAELEAGEFGAGNVKDISYQLRK